MQVQALTQAELDMAEPIIARRVVYLHMAHEDNGIFRDDPSLSKRVREEVATMDIRTLKAGVIPGNLEEAERYIQYCKHLCDICAKAKLRLQKSASYIA